MSTSAATVTNRTEGSMNGYRVLTFTTALAANAEDGVTVPLAWSTVDHVSISHKSASPVASGMSYDYSSGTLTLYGAASGNLLDNADVTVLVVGKD
jgi:hypothetical protein